MKTKEIIEQLRAGGVVVLATDTLYGIVACALNEKAVQRVYDTKGRAPEKPCIILIADIGDLSLFGITVDQLTEQLINRLWPGPISIVLACDKPEFAYLHRGTKTLAFRLPADEEFRAFLRETGPLIAPSANPEGQPPAVTIEEAKAYFSDKVDFYLPAEAVAKEGEDDGRLEGKPSTLVAIENGKVVVLRQGIYKVSESLLS
jgi:L-threonylcarbamoyladenylate synthase